MGVLEESSTDQVLLTPVFHIPVYTVHRYSCIVCVCDTLQEPCVCVCERSPRTDEEEERDKRRYKKRARNFKKKYQILASLKE